MHAPLRFTGSVPTRLSEASAEPVSGLWSGWIPEGSITVLDGNPGGGETRGSCSIWSLATTGHKIG